MAPKLLYNRCDCDFLKIMMFYLLRSLSKLEVCFIVGIHANLKQDEVHSFNKTILTYEVAMFTSSHKHKSQAMLTPISGTCGLVPKYKKNIGLLLKELTIF